MLASDQPQTAPIDAADPRTPRYQANAYQLSQGGRYFSWYGCAQCHGPAATGARDLGDDRWRHGDAIDQVYVFIAHGHSGPLAHYGERIPTEQLWQIAAYVRELQAKDPAKIRREDLDEAGEPQGDSWSGAIR